MCYVMHNGHPLYFPKGEKEVFVRWLYRYAIEDDDIMGNGYRQCSPHAYQSERYHIEKGDVLIDAGVGRGLSSTDVLGEVVDDLTDKVSEVLFKQIHDEAKDDIGVDVGSARGLLALDVIDKVSKVYMVEHAPRWWKPIEATFAPYKDKVELMKGTLAGKKKKKAKEEETQEKKKRKLRLADLLEKCGQQRVFVAMDLEGKELEVLSDAQEYLRAAKNPITLAVCAYHHPTDYENLKCFFEGIGYHTETQPGYIYTDMYDDHGIHSLRKGIIRASNF